MNAVLVYFSMLSSMSQAAETFDWKQASGFVEFRAIGRPSVIHIVGRGERATGHFAIEGRKLSGEAEFSLETLDTKNGTRNQHMKEKYLEVKRFPSAKMTLDACELPGDLKEGASFKGVPFTAHLSLHGVSKPVGGTSDIEQKNKMIEVKANFKMKVDDFAIAIPTFMGITMAADVEIVVEEKFPAKPPP